MHLYFNWKELEFYTESIRPLIAPSKIEQVFVPERKFARHGFIRGEWNFRLKSPKGFLHLNFSVVPQRPTFALFEERGPGASSKATLSPFVQTLKKELTGAIIEGIENIEKDRTVYLELRLGEKKSRLFLFLFPNRPNAQLIVKNKILADANNPNIESKLFTEPVAPKTFKNMGIRTELLSTPWEWGTFVQDRLIATELESRKASLSKTISQELKTLEKTLKKLKKTEEQLGSDPDWSRFGDLLKANLHETFKPIKKGKETFVSVFDYATGKTIQIPFDPKLKPQKNLEKFYRLAARQKKRSEETQIRKREFEKKKKAKTADLKKLDKAKGFREILELEEHYVKEKPRRPIRKSWSGKSFLSKDEFSILVGKSEAENRSLTFHIAKGNDIWLHLKNRPSTHVIILSKKNKSVPLESLLDAATLCVYYTVGRSKDKLDVDYTFRKNVSSIPKSAKVSYHSEKTLHIQIDPKRLERLLATINS